MWSKPCEGTLAMQKPQCFLSKMRFFSSDRIGSLLTHPLYTLEIAGSLSIRQFLLFSLFPTLGIHLNEKVFTSLRTAGMMNCSRRWARKKKRNSSCFPLILMRFATLLMPHLMMLIAWLGWVQYKMGWTLPTPNKHGGSWWQFHASCLHYIRSTR